MHKTSRFQRKQAARRALRLVAERADWHATAASFAAWVVLAIGGGWLLGVVNRRIAMAGPKDPVLCMDWVWWYVFSTFYGACLALRIGRWVYQWRRPTLGPDPLHWQSGFDEFTFPGRLSRSFVLLPVLAGLLLCGLALRKHVVITPDAIVEQRAFAWSADVIPLRDVRSVSLSRRWVYSARRGGRFASALQVHVHTAERIWWPDGWLSPLPLDHAGLAGRIAARAGVTVEYPDTILGL